MIELIRQKLSELEAENGFRILYACESGSRAWGFASKDSDYDIRVIYSWPQDRYLGVFTPPDTFDCGVDENDLDVSCWDFRKALALFRKTNGPLFEWLFSPIVYLEHESVMSQWRSLARDSFVPAHSAAHYLGLSSKINGVIRETGVSTAKKYLYVLRALLSALHVVDHQTPPPVEFAVLLQQLDLPAEVRLEIDSMIAEKATGSEGDRIQRNAVLDSFIDEQSDALKEKAMALPSEMSPVDPLDSFFRTVIA